MLNHVRTLLMNENGVEPQPDIPGEELIDLNFRQRKLSGAAADVYRVLFGARPDRWMKNYRCWQLLRVLHATELLQFVTQDDPRITYDFSRSDWLSRSAFGSRVTPIGATTGRLVLVGEEEEPDRTGVIVKRYEIRRVGSDTVETLLRTGAEYPIREVQEFSGTDDVSGLFHLAGSLRQIRMFNSTGGSEWHLEDRTRPRYDVGKLLQGLDELAMNTWVELFALDRAIGQEEPLRTWGRCWLEHREAAYRLGGVLLALARSIAELPV